MTNSYTQTYQVVNEYPSDAVESKVAKSLLKGADSVFLSRLDIRDLAKSRDFSGAPNTVKFLKEVKAEAKKAGSWFVRFRA